MDYNKVNWDIVVKLCENNDHWDFKYYILVMLFYRFLSEDLLKYINFCEIEAGVPDFDYAALSDEEASTAREDIINTKGYFLLPSQLFYNLLKNAETNENLNEDIESVFRSIESSASGQLSESSFKGLFDKFDANSKDLGDTFTERNKRIVRMMNGIASLHISDSSEQLQQSYGEVYEHLMGMFASEAGKEGGDSFTPSHISILLTRLALVGKNEVSRIYDPACGSGSLLLKSASLLGKDRVHSFFGQDINPTIYNLCRINMFLHGIDYDKFNIAREDTLTEPQHWDDEPFEIIVSNPKFDIKWAGDDNPLLINDPRYSPAGVLAPKARPYFAFVMHSLAWLSNDGSAVMICEPGALYRSNSKAEPLLRKYLIDNNYIDCIIQLAEKLFFNKGKGGSLPVCVIVLKKNKSSNSTLFIDASTECEKVKNGNTLTNTNIERIVQAYIDRCDIPEFCSLIDNSEIAANDYILSVQNYVIKEDTSEEIDIEALNAESNRIIERVNNINSELDGLIAEIEQSKSYYQRISEKRD